LIDPSGAQVAEHGHVGEIAVRGPLVMPGYWKRPAETDAAFTSDGWLRTGDLGQFDEDGWLSIVGRQKEMVISGGFNVYPREVEDVINEHPAVSSSAVFGVPDEKWGESVVAVVVLKDPTHHVDPSVIVDAVRYAKGPVSAPKRIHIIPEMPLTPVGKIDKQKLREITELEHANEQTDA
jgi:fatty-acyl-CoA synthase